MLICDSHKFIFIHVPRTGGTSISELCDRLQLKTREPFRKHTYSSAEVAQNIPFQQYTTFAFVRNPWARFYSWYTLFAKFNPRKEQETFTFDQFLANYERIAKSYGMGNVFLFNQLDCLRNKDGNLITTLIGRYETYAHDVVQIFQQFGIEVDQLPHLNKATDVDYRNQYSHFANQWIENYCAEDIAYFGYQFDG
ncbi:MAG: sulfotransferase family 2 domain-containing protein [Chloroflexota bacterium]